MAVPEKILITQDDYWMDTIGRCRNDQQFMAFVTGSLPVELLVQPDSLRHKRWYAVLHRFDDDGHHLSTDAWCGGTTFDGEQEAIGRAKAKLAEWLDQLQPYELGNVLVRPFSIEIDGRTFGLIAGYYDENSAELLPNGLGFHEPWNGDYDM